MSVADKLTKLTTDITSAYNTIQSKGGTIPAHKNTDNLSSAISSIPTDEWQPQPDWWDIKSIVENDTENYPYKIIVLQDEGAKTQFIRLNNYQTVFNSKKVKLSDGQEITETGIYTVGENGLRLCSKGYKTFYSIWYYNENPNFSYNNIGSHFPNSRYIYFFNVTTINLNSSFSWTGGEQNPFLESIESNKTIATTNSNQPLGFNQAFNLKKYPIFIFNRSSDITPNNVGISGAPYIKYDDYVNIIKSKNFNFVTGNAPEFYNTFFNGSAIIDFENDLDMDTTLFTRLNSIFGAYGIRKINCENVTTFAGRCYVAEIYEISNIKVSTSNYFYSNSLSHNTLIRILNALYDYSESSDTYTLTLGATNLAKLTAEEIAIGTNKGWTIN